MSRAVGRIPLLVEHGDSVWVPPIECACSAAVFSDLVERNRFHGDLLIGAVDTAVLLYTLCAGRTSEIAISSILL